MRKKCEKFKFYVVRKCATNELNELRCYFNWNKVIGNGRIITCRIMCNYYDFQFANLYEPINEIKEKKIIRMFESFVCTWACWMDWQRWHEIEERQYESKKKNCFIICLGRVEYNTQYLSHIARLCFSRLLLPYLVFSPFYCCIFAISIVRNLIFLLLSLLCVTKHANFKSRNRTR